MTDSTRKSASGGQEARKRKHRKERVATTGYGMGAKMLMKKQLETIKNGSH